jgi:anti-sigma factor RsiW
MTCAQFGKLLALYVEQDLSEGKRLKVEAHLSACPRCRAFFESLSRSQSLLKGVEQEPPGWVDHAIEQVHARVLGQLAEPSGRSEFFLLPFARRYAGPLSAMAGLALLAAGLVLGLRHAGGGVRTAAPNFRPARAASRHPAGLLKPGATAPEGTSGARRVARLHRPRARLANVQRRSRPIRRAGIQLASTTAPRKREPLKVMLLTDDPDVVIYWLVD